MENHDKLIILETQLNTLIDMVGELKESYKELPDIELKIAKLEMEIDNLKREIKLVEDKIDEHNKKVGAVIKWAAGIISGVIVAAILVFLGLK